MKEKPAEHKTRLLPGIKPVLEIMEENPHKFTKIYIKKNFRKADIVKPVCKKFNIPLYEVDVRELDNICGNSIENPVKHQGIVGFLSDAAFSTLDEIIKAHIAPLPVIIALDQVKDPGNLGTLCRTAWALGAGGMMLPLHKSAALGLTASRAAAGTLERMPFVIVPNLAKALEYLKLNHFAIYGCKARPQDSAIPNDSRYADAFSFDWPEPCVLVLGSEEKGLRPGVAKRCDLFLSIPFARPFDSLNIAQAGAILLGLYAARNSSSIAMLNGKKA